MAHNPQYPVSLNPLEILDLLVRLAIIAFMGTWAAISGPFRGPRGARTYRQHVSHSVLRHACSILTVRHAHTTTTAKSYEVFTRRRGLMPRTVTWGEDGQGHWLGDSGARHVLIWFHGGGYYSPAQPAYYEFLSSVLDTVRAEGHDFAVFVVSYTLAPHGQYPCQLRQGLEALGYILRAGGRLPSDLVLGGDSAGANLVLGMLSHFSHPNDEIYTGPSLTESLRGVILLGPWVSFDPDWPSVEKNKCKDCITVIPTTVNQKWFLGTREKNNYNEPINAPFAWWRGVMARKILFIAGEDEIMVDSQRLFGERLAAANPENTKVMIVPGEAHVAPILDLMLWDRMEFESGRAIKSWLLFDLLIVSG